MCRRWIDRRATQWLGVSEPLPRPPENACDAGVALGLHRVAIAAGRNAAAKLISGSVPPGSCDTRGLRLRRPLRDPAENIRRRDPRRRRSQARGSGNRDDKPLAAVEDLSRGHRTCSSAVRRVMRVELEVLSCEGRRHALRSVERDFVDNITAAKDGAHACWRVEWRITEEKPGAGHGRVTGRNPVSDAKRCRAARAVDYPNCAEIDDAARKRRLGLACVEEESHARGIVRVGGCEVERIPGCESARRWGI